MNINIDSTYLSNMLTFQILAPLRPLFQINLLKKSKPIQMNIFFKNFIKIGCKMNKFQFWNSPVLCPFHVKNCNSYIIILCMFLKGIFLRNLKKKTHQKQMKNKLPPYNNQKKPTPFCCTEGLLFGTM